MAQNGTTSGTLFVPGRSATRIAACAVVFAFAFACGGSTPEPKRTPHDDARRTAPVARPATTVRALSFNLRHDRDEWKIRFDLIARELSRLRPHIIGAQEVEIGIDQTRALADRLANIEGSPNYYVFERLKHGRDRQRGEGIAIYSQFPLIETDWRKLSHGRIALFARVQLADDSTLDVYNTHLHDKGSDILRKTQAETLVSWIEQNSAGREVLLLGDFNAEPSSKAIQAITSHLKDSHAAANPNLEGFTTPVVLSRTSPRQALARRIDYVFFRAQRAWKVLNVENVMATPDETGLMPSDHLGVMATFEIPRK